ncbi:MAG: hypothetical protein FJ091_19875 [Deltaproteobacteria bacterium]|nr:hypothetical protein [Deltaproteobacteria bacterium]
MPRHSHPALLVLGLVTAAGAIPHAIGGWPPAAVALGTAGVDPDLIGGIAAGWYFGSAAMLAFGAIVVLAWRDARAGGDFGWRAALAVAATYLAFGLGALAVRGVRPHFLGFVAIGAGLAWTSLRARPGRS